MARDKTPGEESGLRQEPSMEDRVAPLPVLPPSDCPACERRKVLVREDSFCTVSDAWKDRASGMVSLNTYDIYAIS